MKRSFWVRLLVIVAIFSGILFPIFNQQSAAAQSPDHTVFLPIVRQALPPIIPDTTVVLTVDSTQYLESVSADGSVYTFSQSTAELAQLDPNDVMVSDANANAPNGFLRQVTAVQEDAGRVEVTTVQGTLEDAIEQGELSVNMTLTPDMVREQNALEGVHLVSGPEALFSYDLNNVVLYDADGNSATTGDQILANGQLSLELGADFDFSIGFFRLKELYFTIWAREMAGLSISTNIPVAGLSEEVTLATYRFLPKTIFVAQVPVVFTPIVSLVVGIDGSIHVGIATSVTQSLGVSAGLGYRDGEWGTHGAYLNSFTYVPPFPTADMNIKGYLGPELELELYGVAGPYARALAYLQMEVDSTASPWWELFGGLEIPVGIRVEVLGHELADQSTVALNLRWLLASSNGGGGYGRGYLPGGSIQSRW